MTLKKYNKKRNFKVTPEPYGKKRKKSDTLLYLIQKHAASHLHYDLRLELNGTLKSWAVPKGPSLDPTVKRLAVHVEDHPIEYGSFEGIIPAGEYGGGAVMLWDTGEWECLEPNPLAAYKKGSLSFTIKGKKLKGAWKLVRIKTDPKNWLLIKINDRYAKAQDDYDIIQKKPNSVVSKRSIDRIAQKAKMPTVIRPELATLVDKAPSGNDWIHEIKFDGYRIISFIKSGKVKLMTRNQHDWTEKFPALKKELLKTIKKECILDGELVALNAKQHTDFQLLQNLIHSDKTATLVYYVFDLLYYNNVDLTEKPLLDRKQQLKKIIDATDGIVRYSDHILGQGDKLFKKACKLGLEGVIAKDINSHYRQQRTRDWLKIKCSKRQEFIVVGFTQPSGKRSYFGSLLLAVYDKNKKLTYTGNVGTGFTALSLKTMSQLLSRYKASKPTLTPIPKGLGLITWLKPTIVVEVEFTEWTQDGALRHPSFKGVRKDKSPLAIIREQSHAK